MVSVLPSGIDVRKLQRSHSEISRVEPLSDLPSRLFSVYLFDLAILFSVFRQTLSDITLDRSKVKSDKLPGANTNYEHYSVIDWLELQPIKDKMHCS